MKLIFFGGILTFFGAIALIISNYSDIKVEKEGMVVKMRIERLPSSCLGTRIKHFTTLSYNGKMFVKRIGDRFCDEHYVGELIDIRFLEDSSTVLFPNESVIPNLLAFGGLAILGIIMSFSQFNKIRNEK